MGLLRTIAILIIVYYAFKLVGKYIMPLFVKKVFSNVEKKMREQQEKNQHDPNIKEGETVIDKKPSSVNKSNDKVGDYVDYEEVD